MTVIQQLAQCQNRIMEQLQIYLPDLPSDPLRQAMRYATLEGGKRLRPFFVYTVANMYNLPETAVDPIAVAIECIHCYSLVHDDLPAMDNDDVRRGKPTCHRAFDEATAILAGDGLLTLAFEILAQDALHVTAIPRLISLIAQAAGMNGMIQGQIRDLRADCHSLTLPDLIAIHRAKTGALITASILASALVAQQVPLEEIHALKNFGDSVGLAFQIRDDILDGTTDSIPSFATVLGLAEAQKYAQYYQQQAIEALYSLGNRADPLRAISNFVIERGW